MRDASLPKLDISYLGAFLYCPYKLGQFTVHCRGIIIIKNRDKTRHLGQNKPQPEPDSHVNGQQDGHADHKLAVARLVPEDQHPEQRT